jgi:protein-glutamine gamma-glutamyltransferase
MITINNHIVGPEELIQLMSNDKVAMIIHQMALNNSVYKYHSIDQLKFELTFRLNTIRASDEQNRSEMYFSTYEYSKCNPEYWERLNNGGFRLKSKVLPSQGLLDIIKNGSLYATECATAIAIVLYLATLYTIGANTFNKYFRGLYLIDWEIDEDLPLISIAGEEYIPGDVVYFNNPDFNPKTPEWRGLNAVYFGHDTFYGHGVGIRNSREIIDFLNKLRKRESMRSAYLMQYLVRPYYKSLYQLGR